MSNRLFAIDLFCFRRKYLVFNLVTRNLKVKYRYSLFGFLWTLIVPLSTAFVYYAVFNLILKIQIPNYLPFILSGVLLWGFFIQTVLEGMDSVVANSQILTKVPVPVQVFPLSGAITNFFTLVMSLPVVAGAMIYSNISITWSVLWLPFILLALFQIAYGLAVFFSLVSIYFRDIKHICGIVLQLWFYGTPVLYQESMIPKQYLWMLDFNPVGSIFTSIHKICISSTSPTLRELLMISVWTLAGLLLPLLSLKLLSRRAVESL